MSQNAKISFISEYYDENMLHGLLISEVKDYEESIRLTDRFLPFVDNWAVCDIMSPKVFAKHKEELLRRSRLGVNHHTFILVVLE